MSSHEHEGRRRIRWPRRRRSQLLVVALIALTAAVPVAWANHEFTDVPAASPHHNDISAIRNAGITGGCGTGVYCPDQAVRRDQMASFVVRSSGRGAVLQASETVTATTTPDQVIGSVAISVPGNGYVLVNASTDYFISGGTCNVIQRIVRPTSGDASFYSGTGTGSAGDTGVSSTLLSPVTSGAGTRVFELHARKFSGACTADANVDMNAIWVPFNASGGGVTAPATPGPNQPNIQAGAPGGNPEG